MNRMRLAIWALAGVASSVGRAAPAQVCPWGMHAQLQMQIQWQHQQTMQQQIVQQMQARMAHQQALQQHRMAQTLAVQQHQQAMQAHLAAQMQLQRVNQTQQITTTWQRAMRRTHTGGVPIHRDGLRTHAMALPNPRTHSMTLASHRFGLQTRTSTLPIHRFTTQARTESLSIHRPTLQAHAVSLPIHRVSVQAKNLASSHHSPSVQIRASLGMTCGHCHQSQPSAPTLALKPPGTPFKTFVNNPRQPTMPRRIAAVRPMPKAIAQQQRQPLLPFVASRPVIQPIVHLPRTMPVGSISVRLPMQPPGAPTVAPAPPPLGPIALLRPPPLPLIHKPLNLVPLPSMTRSPGDSMPQESTPPTAALSSLDDPVSQFVALIAQGKPSTPRRDDDTAATPILSEMIRQAPPRPVLETKYPMPSLMAATERPAPSATTTKPSLVEVVLRPPQLPALPEPAAQPTPVP